MWKIRSGTFPSVGAVRKRGTTVHHRGRGLPGRAAGGCRHGPDASSSPGTATTRPSSSATPRTATCTSSSPSPSTTRRRSTATRRFIDDVVELVVKKYDGALKAEHGTGRNMAPFVEAEWGPEAKAVMEPLKALVDPDAPAQPGRDPQPRPARPPGGPQAHARRGGGSRQVHRVRLLRAQVPEPGADPHAPAAHRGAPGDGPSGRTPARTPPCSPSLEAAFPYMAVETCAVDGLCATACPVGIDTGQLTKRFRRASHSRLAQTHRPGRWPATSPRWNRSCAWRLRSGHLVQACSGPGPCPPSPGCSGRPSAPPTSGAPRCRRPAKARLPLTDPGRGPGHLLPGLHLPHHGPPARRARAS